MALNLRPARRHPSVAGALLVALGLLGAGCTPPAPGPPTPATRQPTWTRTVPLPSGFTDSPLMAWLEGTFVLIGGSTRVESSSDKPPDTTVGHRYDPVSDAWTPIADSPIPFDWADPHVVLGGALYVVTTEIVDQEKSPDGGPWVCSSQRFFSYHLATDAWRELPLPAGQCSLDGPGLVATDDALVVLDTGSTLHWLDADGGSHQEPALAGAVDAVYDPDREAWDTRSIPAAQQDSVRWASWTGGGLLVAAEDPPADDAMTTSAPGLPTVYAWDYHSDDWDRVDRAGSENLEWREWTGRMQTPTGPTYFQNGALLGFNPATGTFQRRTPECGAGSCEFDQVFTGSISDQAVFPDGWTLATADLASRDLVLVNSADATTIALPDADDLDPSGGVSGMPGAGGEGEFLSCPIQPRNLPEGIYIDTLGRAAAELTHDGNAGTGEPGALIRLTITDESPLVPTSYPIIAVERDGTWEYPGIDSRPPTETVSAAEYLLASEMRPFCQLLRY